MKKTALFALFAFLTAGLAAGQEPDSLTAAERQVREIIAEDGVHVVHFWAPWCHNSMNELPVWPDLVERNDEVSFTFVTIWNNGESAKRLLEMNGLHDRVREVVQPDRGPSSEQHLRRRSFLGLPVTWIPSTWIFNKNGRLAFMMNYGEMSAEAVQTFIDAAGGRW